MLRASLVTALSLAMLSACGPIFGSGRFAEEERAIGSWRVVHVGDAIRVNVVQGAPGVRLAGDDNLIREVETVLEGDALVLRLPPGTWFSSSLGITATVSGERFEGGNASGASTLTGAATGGADFAIEASGASKVMISDLNTPAAKVTASGASKVTLAGRTDLLTVNASGASTIDALGAPAASAQIEATGDSLLQLHVTESIRGALSGASRLMLQGSPSTDVHTSGGSLVIRN